MPAQHTSFMANGQIKSPIVEWYLMGEVDILLSTGTTFGLFAAARTGFRNEFWVWNSNEKPELRRQPETWSKCGQDICF
jgi:hypothetical protein